MARRRGLQLGVVLLLMELFQHGLHHIPPVTLVTTGINILGYMGIIPVLASVRKTCVSYANVWKRRQWKRLIFASYVHLDDMHLYYNMVSFLWKGRSLERRIGSRRFAIIIALFSVLTQLVMILLNKIFASYIFFNSDYLTQCAAGFSAVIFGLKVITTHYMSEHETHILGLPLPVPPKLACWVELIVIQIMVPNASFTGHLAGILVGLAYVKGPLSIVVKTIDRFIPGGPQWPQTRGQQTNTGRFRNESRRLGNADDDKELQEAIRRSLQDTHVSQVRRHVSPPMPGWNIPGVSPSYQASTSRPGHQSDLPYPVHDSGSMPSVPFPTSGHQTQESRTPRFDQAPSAPPIDDMESTSLYPDLHGRSGDRLYSVD